MNPNALVRFFSGKDYKDCEQILDQQAKRNPNWRIVSVSHFLSPGLVSVAVVFHYVGPAVANISTADQFH